MLIFLMPPIMPCYHFQLGTLLCMRGIKNADLRALWVFNLHLACRFSAYYFVVTAAVVRLSADHLHQPLYFNLTGKPLLPNNKIN
jgi:hypothetical protein